VDVRPASRRQAQDVRPAPAQHLPSKLKLKLIENEEHLFDAGLYCGFVGTVLALVFFPWAWPNELDGRLFLHFFWHHFRLDPQNLLRASLSRQLIIESESRAEAEAA